MWSQAAPIEEITVVSEIGEQWSPKRPPDRTDPIVANKDNLTNSLFWGIPFSDLSQKIPIYRKSFTFSKQDNYAL